MALHAAQYRVTRSIYHVHRRVPTFTPGRRSVAAQARIRVTSRAPSHISNVQGKGGLAQWEEYDDDISYVTGKKALPTAFARGIEPVHGRGNMLHAHSYANSLYYVVYAPPPKRSRSKEDQRVQRGGRRQGESAYGDDTLSTADMD
eukprot:7541002-Pyramimonas_sp.AAC.1